MMAGRCQKGVQCNVSGAERCNGEMYVMRAAEELSERYE